VPVIIVSDRLATDPSVSSLSTSHQLLSQQLQHMHLNGDGQPQHQQHQEPGLQSPQQQQQQQDVGLQLQQQQQKSQALQQGLCFLPPAAFFGLFFRGGQSPAVFDLFDSLLQVRVEHPVVCMSVF